MILRPFASSFSLCFLACSLYWPSPDIMVVFVVFLLDCDTFRAIVFFALVVSHLLSCVLL